MSSIIIEEWRDLWTFKVDYILVSIAWVFANENFLHLPYLIAHHGGLTFVIAYVTCLFVVCLPLIMMELAVGQLTGRAPVQALFNMCPLFKGVGVAQIILSLAFASYLAVKLSHVLLFGFYVVWNIIKETSIWAACDNSWNTESCFHATNTTQLSAQIVFTEKSGLEEFIQNYLIRPSERIDEPGFFVWRVTASLGVVWFLVFLAVFAGVRWLGKVCYFTFTIPLLLLVVLLIRGVTLSGTLELIHGIFISSGDLRWEHFLDFELWTVAFSRCLLSVGLGFGAFITLGSYNKRSNNLVGDSFLILFVHIATTTLQIFAVVGMCGYLASILNLVEPHEILKPGIRSLYMFLLALCQLPMYSIWIVVCLCMVAFTILNILYILSMNMLSAAEDTFGEGASRCLPRLGLAFAISLLCFAVGLGHSTNAGPYSMALMSHFLGKISIWVILAFEIIAVAWFYCAHLLGRDIRQMIYGCCCWLTGWIFMYLLYLLPAVPIYIIVMNMWHYNFQMDINMNAIVDVVWSEPIGWCIAIIPVLPIPIFMLYIIIKTCIRGPGLTYCQRFKYTVISPLRYEVVKPTAPPRYTANAPGYVLLPQAPLAEPETYNDVYMERVVKVSNI